MASNEFINKIKGFMESKNMKGIDELVGDFKEKTNAEYNKFSESFKTKIKIKNTSKNKLPEFETVGSAGFDIRANEALVIKPMERKLISTGLYFEFPNHLELGIRPRSGLALKHGITVLNSPGTIDSDYRGELKIMLINLGSEDFNISIGDRISQGVFSNVVAKKDTIFEEVKEINDNTERGSGGFGSTGTK
jgi:dUTP pyrophosphatase